MESLAPYEQFEVEWARWANVNNVVGCNSGTAALHLALETTLNPLGPMSGDWQGEVVTCDFNMIACPRAIALAGYKPVFVDCDENLLMNINNLSAVINYRTVGILVTHIYGRKVNMEAVHDVARKNRLRVIEDLAEAHGVAPHPETDAACWSFYRNKIVRSEEGGAIAFRHTTHAKHAKSLRSMGFTDSHNFMHIPRGHNYRLSDSLAVLAMESLKHADSNLARRRQIERWYDSFCPEQWRMPAREVVWVYDLKIPGLCWAEQEHIVKTLNAEGIGARCSFKPMSIQEEFKTIDANAWAVYNQRIVGAVSNAYDLSNQVFYLPVEPIKTTEDKCEKAFQILKKALADMGKTI